MFGFLKNAEEDFDSTSRLEARKPKKKSKFLQLLMYGASLFLLLLAVIAPFFLLSTILFLIIQYAIDKKRFSLDKFSKHKSTQGFIAVAIIIVTLYFFNFGFVFILHRKGYKPPSILNFAVNIFADGSVEEFVGFIASNPIGWGIAIITVIAIILGAILTPVGVKKKQKKTTEAGVVCLGIAAAIPFMYFMFVITVKLAL